MTERKKRTPIVCAECHRVTDDPTDVDQCPCKAIVCLDCLEAGDHDYGNHQRDAEEGAYWAHLYAMSSLV